MKVEIGGRYYLHPEMEPPGMVEGSHERYLAVRDGGRI
jgi:hypothetical protein